MTDALLLALLGLPGADLSGARLRDANLSGADLRGADMTGVKGCDVTVVYQFTLMDRAPGPAPPGAVGDRYQAL